jgi:hypothetical protein
VILTYHRICLSVAAYSQEQPLENLEMPPNSALLTDTFSSLRCACGAAKRGR